MGEILPLAEERSFELLRAAWVGEALLLERLFADSGRALGGDLEDLDGARAAK